MKKRVAQMGWLALSEEGPAHVASVAARASMCGWHVAAREGSLAARLTTKSTRSHFQHCRKATEPFVHGSPDPSINGRNGIGTKTDNCLPYLISITSCVF